MGWFGGGSDDTSSSSSGAEKGFMDSSSSLHNMDHHSSGMDNMGGGASTSDFEQFSMAIQQQMVVQQAITELTEKAFAKCITQCKDSHLSGKEAACIHAVTNKWLDANEYMVGRLARKQQQASGQQSY
ncbi:hypothetical protein MPSEU_000462500 [Mayamaea pseudoterrestris]|nr:hypothetical protein MPSEU_000462500 [Mayamaea pseudoterrestris]